MLAASAARRVQCTRLQRRAASAPRVLVADCVPGTRRRMLDDLRSVFPAFRLMEASSAHELAGAPAASLALVDVELLRGHAAAVRSLRQSQPGLGLIVTSDRCEAELVRAALAAGAVSFLIKGQPAVQLRGTIEAALQGRGLMGREIVASLIAQEPVAPGRDRTVVESLAAAVEAKDAVTSRHLRSVRGLALQLARLVDPALAESPGFEFGCLLHDMGKIGVPEAILGKPGPLNESEWALMRLHPEIGIDVLDPLGLPAIALDLVRHHHERWDGDGYPDGLAGEEIPIAARVFSVCDALDAMTAPRPYRAAVSAEVALARVRAQAGKQFDPGVVAVLERGVARGEIQLHHKPANVRAAAPVAA